MKRRFFTITPKPNKYCLDSGFNTCIVNHLIARYRNLRNLQTSISVETASSAENLTINYIFDEGEITAVRYRPEASASLVPPDTLNDCGVAMHLYKIRGGPRGKRRCMLVAHRREIGGEPREFPDKAIRANGL